MLDFSINNSFAEEDINDLFQHFFSAYSGAAKILQETIDFYFQTANKKIRLQFAGKNLAVAITQALSHLETAPTSEPDFTIYIWDTVTSGQKLPKILDHFNQFVNSHPNSGLRAIRGNVPFLCSENFRTALMGRSALSMANFREKVCLHWVFSAEEIPYFERGAPLRVPFTFMFGDHSGQLIHGGAVGHPDGGVFLGGVGGSGKSTTALNCLDSDLKYASDDYVLINLEPKPAAASLYNTVKLKTLKDLERFPNFRKCLSNEEGVISRGEKPMIFLNEHFPDRLIAEIPLKAIIFPKFIANAKINYQTMPQKRAFREIVTSTIRQTPNDDQTAISMIGRFIKELPCYELIFGSEQMELPKYINEIVDQNS